MQKRSVSSRVYSESVALGEMEGRRRGKTNLWLYAWWAESDKPQALWQTWIIEYTVCIHYLSGQTACWIRNQANIKSLMAQVPGFMGQPRRGEWVKEKLSHDLAFQQCQPHLWLIGLSVSLKSDLLYVKMDNRDAKLETKHICWPLVAGCSISHTFKI